MNYVIYDENGNILKYGVCSKEKYKTRKESGERIMQIDIYEDELDIIKKVVNHRLVDKTSDEIKLTRQIQRLPEGQQIAIITNSQWTEVLARLDALEK